jgi:hypothetical protein
MAYYATERGKREKNCRSKAKLINRVRFGEKGRGGKREEEGEGKGEGKGEKERGERILSLTGIF